MNQKSKRKKEAGVRSTIVLKEIDGTISKEQLDKLKDL